MLFDEMVIISNEWVYDEIKMGWNCGGGEGKVEWFQYYMYIIDKVNYM